MTLLALIVGAALVVIIASAPAPQPRPIPVKRRNVARR